MFFMSILAAGGPDRMNAALLPATHARSKLLRVSLVIEPPVLITS